MIIVKLNGGLGNQMFQYALGRVLSEKYGVKLKMDVSFFDSQYLRKFELDIFYIDAEIITTKQLNRYIANEGENFFYRAIRKVSDIFNKYSTVFEKQFSYSSEIINVTSNTYLIGYWQTEKYFSAISDLIRKDFKFKNVPSFENSQVIEKIITCNSVSIHIRRGDYISNIHTNEVHGTCDIEYYDKAISLMAQKVKDPVFFIFSDDLDWVKKNIPIVYEHYHIDNNSDKGYEDMRLMSNCKNNIIANSSFSWWAAWLNNNSNKVVIAPSKWFNDIKKDAKDIIPDSWIKL